jgi:hypothetical protein
MKFRSAKTMARVAFWLGLVFFISILSACASAQHLPNHSFEFHAARDSPEVEILDYRYGDSKQPGARASEWDKSIGRVQMGGAVYGAMLRGDFLYVKWRVKATSKIYEDTADLKACLPRDITEHTIYFVVRGTQLNVYLVTPQKRVESDPPGPLRMYSDLKVTTLHPTCSR